MADGYTLTERTIEILASFGSLAIVPLKDGTQVRGLDTLEFVPDPMDDPSSLAQKLGATCFPIGSYGQGSVIHDSRDRVFVSIGTGEFLVAGETFEDGLDGLLIGRRLLKWI
jgi:hypothetical protein